ncbi:MULE transposase domain containing protein [Nitzschia inconspicua]|uniref:MULE transposase domain containing protein n=1 Tax=Nitzschia inconspicua TaxID=303405 RepID=A0A9K3LE12_9STRA|nr:MULE transposase domain containing protein [Nitzschia inconspicua]
MHAMLFVDDPVRGNPLRPTETAPSRATAMTALYHGLSANPEWATLENVSSFFPALLPSLRNESSPAEDGELVDETCQEDEGPNKDEELVAETRPENSIHDVEDKFFEKQFAGPSQVFQTVEELMVVIMLTRKRPETLLPSGDHVVHPGRSPASPMRTVHSGLLSAQSHGRKVSSSSGETVTCGTAASQLHPRRMEGVHKKKTLLSYKQCYRGVNARKESKIISDSMSFQFVGPYVQTFAQRNPGSTAFMERGSDNRIQRVFVCPSFANDVLMCVRPVISIDAAHMRSEWKGTLYLATVKSALDDLYPVAYAITVDGEDLQGWLWFLEHLKASAPNLITEHFRRECSYKLFTFMSDRGKGLITALRNVFPDNHNCYCVVHIRRNVETEYGKKIANMVTPVSTTSSLPEKRALLTQLERKSPTPTNTLRISARSAGWTLHGWKTRNCRPGMDFGTPTFRNPQITC